MNKKIVPVLVVVALLAGAGYYFKTKSPGSYGSQSTGQAMNEATEFSKAMESGKPTVCTMTKDKDVMEYMISGKKMRINTTTSNTNDKGVVTITTAHMISDTSYLYSWTDSSKQGSKMAIPTEEETKAMAEKAKDYQPTSTTAPKFDESEYQGFKDQGYTINCKSGSVPDSAFIPPTDIQFIDPTEMMKQVTGANGQVDYQKLQEQYGSMQYGQEE